MINLTTEQLAYFEAGEIRPVLLVEIDSTPAVHITTAPYPITFEGNVYEASGQIDSMDPQSRTNQIGNRSFKVGFKSSDQSLPAVLFDDANQNVSATVYLVFLDDQSNIVFSDIYEKLKANGVQDSESPSQSKTILNMGTQLAAFQKMGGIATNLKSHQRHYPGDMFFEFTSTSQKPTYWAQRAPRATVKHVGTSKKISPPRMNQN